MLPNFHLFRIQTCLATRGSMVKRPLGTTGIGLLPRSNTRRSVAGHSATILTVMTGLVGQQGSSRGCDCSRGDRNHGRAVGENAVGVTQASTACDSTLALATEKDTERSRLGELHRLLNNRKGSLIATTQITGPTI